MEKIGLNINVITTTHRLGKLKSLLESFKNGTDLRNFNIKWIFYVGMDVPANVNISDLKDEKDVIIIKGPNIGPGPASDTINQFNRHAITLFLEDDWLLVPDGYKSNWLSIACEFLIAKEAEMIILRRFVRQAEAARHFFNHRLHAHTMNFPGVQGVVEEDGERNIDFFKSHPLYTNNPHLRLEEAYFNKIYPLAKDVPVESRERGNWGIAESFGETKAKANNLDTWWMKKGIFVHSDDLGDTYLNEYNGMPKLHKIEEALPCNYRKCKFDFLYYHPVMCLFCRNEYEWYDFWRIQDQSEDFVKAISKDMQAYTENINPTRTDHASMVKSLTPKI